MNEPMHALHTQYSRMKISLDNVPPFKKMNHSQMDVKPSFNIDADKWISLSYYRLPSSAFFCFRIAVLLVFLLTSLVA